jgi:branched-chain amino acid transport system substrate-binding protein
VALGLAIPIALNGLGAGDDGKGGGHRGGLLGGGHTAQGGVVSLGFMGELTGQNSGLVNPARRGVQLAIDEYNATNPTTKITLKSYDSAGGPAKALSLTDKAVRTDKVAGMIGPMFSGEAAAVGPVLEEDKVPSVSPAASNPALGDHGWRYWHRIVADDDAQGEGMGTFISSGMNARRVFVIDEASPYGKSLAAQVKQAVEQTGATTATDTIETQATDYSSTANKVVAFGPDAIFFAGYYPQAAKLIKQLRHDGVAARFLSGDGSLDPHLASSSGSATAYGSIVGCTCLIDPTGKASPASKTFADRYRAKFGDRPSTYSAEGYDAATAFITVIKAGNASPAAINAALASVNVAGVSRQIRFKPDGEPAAPVVYLYQFAGNNPSLLGTATEAKISGG